MLLTSLRALSVFCFLSLTLFGASGAVISPGVKTLRGSLHHEHPLRSPDPEPVDQEVYIPLIIQLYNPAAELPESVVELHRRGDLVLAYVPESAMGQLTDAGYFRRVEGGVAGRPTLDQAMTFTGMDRVIAADGLPRRFTGKGVVVGFTDAGFDPNHIEFRNPAGGSSRVAFLSHYGATPDEIVRMNDKTDIAGWTTDNPDMYHATHVAGIMAGGYSGNAYRGVAPESTIAATTSILYDPLLLAGMEDIVAFAGSQGKPAVINMSVSSPLGPHDGTSLFSLYLSRLAEDAVICISSGNDGMRTGLASNRFDGTTPMVVNIVDYPSMASWYASGMLDVWGEDESVPSLAITIYDRETKEIVMRRPIEELSASNPEIFVEYPDEFEEYMEGSVMIATEINPNNHRFNASVSYDLANYPLSPTSHSIRYAAGLEINGPKDKEYRVYGDDGIYLKICNGYSGRATTNGVVNDFITGEGTIGVGAMTSRNQWPLIDGNAGTSKYEVGKIADFSSFRNDGDSKVLPDVAAPGAHLVSAISSSYMANHPDASGFSLKETIDGKDYYWGASCGTSMSAPYVAGVCALMLEANPDLTPAEVKEIILSTLSTPAVDPGNIRWGRGVLDSHAAVSAARARASLPAINDQADFSPTLPVELFDLSGRLVATVPPGEITPDRVASHLPAGIYILRQGNLVKKLKL